MGKEYSKRPTFSPESRAYPVNTATLSSAAVTLKRGLNLITYSSSGKASDMLLPDPGFIGEEIIVLVDNQTTSLEANINTGATGQLFYGTTFNTATVATTAIDAIPIQLVAATTAQWAVLSYPALPASTAAYGVGWSLSASTGSTGQ